MRSPFALSAQCAKSVWRRPCTTRLPQDIDSDGGVESAPRIETVWLESCASAALPSKMTIRPTVLAVCGLMGSGSVPSRPNSDAMSELYIATSPPRRPRKEHQVMSRTIDEDLLPRPPQPVATPAFAPSTRRAAERLRDQFGMSPDAGEAFAAATVDPSEIRKAAENPERLYVPGGTLYALRTQVWSRRVMPDPRNPRVGPARRHPVAVAPGSTEDARYRPIPEPDPAPNGRPELKLAIEGRQQLAWSTAIAKKYILKDNDWRRSIRNQGVMTEVWLSAVTLVHEDETASVTVPVTSEGSSRVVACHDILGVRSSDVPYVRDDRWLRSRVRSLNEAVNNGPTVEVAEALRCETIPALLLVGFEPHPGSAATFATAVRSLVALRHVEPPRAWNEAAKMGSIADAVLEALAEQELLSSDEELWLLGAAHSGRGRL